MATCTWSTARRIISLRPGATVDVDDLIAYARTHLAPTKYPREIRLLDSVPLTSVGKLDRKALRRLMTVSA
jgi:long-chain acyl-CoA synthetase